ncbi:MAG: heavy-metal-associated domain-containing protein [Bacteroidetes bacterium]|nr:heavy-metal-associated domain-containing protein [Bacteroidota bacterium]
MKNKQFQMYVFAVIASLFIGISFISCKSAHAEKSSTFKVYGNCEMCKKTIETALDTEGIYYSDWNKDSKMINVKYDSTMYSLDQIHVLISNAGYDTETTRATEEAYMGLEECCQYERPM